MISNEDVLQDSGWSLDTMKLVTCLHSTGDIWTMHSLKQLAIRQGHAILRFRLKFANKDNQKNSNLNMLLSDELANDEMSLWGYYLYGAPVTISYNVNISKLLMVLRATSILLFLVLRKSVIELKISWRVLHLDLFL